MKRSTRSLTSIVVLPARSSVSSISKTDASNLPEMRINAISAGVLTMSGDGEVGQAYPCSGELHPDDLAQR